MIGKNLLWANRTEKQPLPLKSCSIGLLLGLGAVLTGCISTTTSQYAQLKADPKAAVATRTALAGQYILAGDLDAAQRSLDAALKIDSRSAEANNMMGVLLQQEGSPRNLEKAETYYKRAIFIDGNYAQARNNYGVYLTGRKRYKEAIEQFEVAGAALGYDGRASALENLGRTYLALGNNEAAEQAFKQALQANRDSVVARFELADLLLKKNQIRPASALYNEYLRYLGTQKQGARSLWLGIRIARAEQDSLRMKNFINQLGLDYPESDEYKRYLQLQKSNEAVWN